MDRLTSTEKTTVDLIALRAFHWKASMDCERDPAIRRWHRQQVKHISLRISRRGEALGSDGQLALVEMMTEQYAENAYIHVARANAGDWELLCQLTREAIVRKLEQGAVSDAAYASPRPCDCRSLSSACDTEGKAAAGSPEGAPASKTEPAPATASGDVPSPEG